MPITPSQARALRSAGTSDVRAGLNRGLEDAAAKIDSGLPLTHHLSGVPSDVAEAVVREWQEYGWPNARIVRDERDGDYIRLD